MQTIGRKCPSKTPGGYAPGRCSYCGVVWPRNKLKRDAAGLYACPDDWSGRDIVTLSRLNAEASRNRRERPAHDDGVTGIDTESPAVPIPPYTPH
jgi:hypothetical protein